MDRTEFFNADGTINMTRALAAGRRARAEAARTGASEVVRALKPRQTGRGILKSFF